VRSASCVTSPDNKGIERDALTSLTSQVRFPADVMFREVAGQSVLLNLKSECYFGLDEVGTRIWSLLSECGSIQATYEALLAEYDAAPEVLRRDLLELIGKLAEQGLIEVCESGASE
jgi:hypothetical protein